MIIYKDAIGDGYHDAHGNPVDAPVEPVANGEQVAPDGEQGSGEQGSGEQLPVVVPVADPKKVTKK